MRFFLILASLGAMASADTLHLIAPKDLGIATVHHADASPMLQHYGQPPDDCERDEQAFQIGGIPGSVCAPVCDSAGRCPSDLPDGVTAQPQCALENKQTGDKYCVLICHEAGKNSLRAGDAQCGDATCQIIQPGLGVCTYV